MARPASSPLSLARPLLFPPPLFHFFSPFTGILSIDQYLLGGGKAAGGGGHCEPSPPLPPPEPQPTPGPEPQKSAPIQPSARVPSKESSRLLILPPFSLEG